MKGNMPEDHAQDGPESRGVGAGVAPEKHSWVFMSCCGCLSVSPWRHGSEKADVFGKADDPLRISGREVQDADRRGWFGPLVQDSICLALRTLDSRRLLGRDLLLIFQMAALYLVIWLVLLSYLFIIHCLDD